MHTCQSVEEARMYINSQLGSYLRGRLQGNYLTCPNPAHTDKHKSAKYYPSTQKVACFSCGKIPGTEGSNAVTYDIFDIIGFDYNLTTEKDKFKKALEIFDVSVSRENTKAQPITKQAKTIAPEVQEAINRQKAEQKAQEETKAIEDAHKVQQAFKDYMPHREETDYLQRRGISKETIRSYPIGYNPQSNEIIFFTSPVSMVSRKADNNAAHNYRYMNTGKVKLWNEKALDSKRPVFVTEGIIDALSIEEAGGIAIALNSGSNVAEFIRCAKKRLWIPPIIALFDKDNTGESATGQLKKGLNDFESILVDGRNMLPGNQDPNDFLLSARADFIKRVREKESEIRKLQKAKDEPYIQEESAGGYLNELRHVIQRTSFIASTGFPVLDKALGGGLYAGLYFIGGTSGVGKTTLSMQLADNIAASGQDVIIFSLEMSKAELICKSVSRVMLMQDGLDNAKSTQDIIIGAKYEKYNEAEKKAIDKAFMYYRENISKHVFIKEGMGNVSVLPREHEEPTGKSIKEVIETHIRRTGNRPVVIIDYVQILAPIDIRATDKQNTDRNVYALKQLARDFNIAVIGVSSFNRESYESPISMSSFKESGAIEYTSDILIGLQPYGMNYKDDETEQARKKRMRKLAERIKELRKRGEALPIQVKILKQRFAPPTDLTLDFWSRYNTFVQSTSVPVDDEDIPEDIREQAEQQSLVD